MKAPERVQAIYRADKGALQLVLLGYHSALGL
jgi:hypothetical protein